ncbi:MAG TPA: hypothetical protein VHR43_03525 [Gemmatimonadales bacterium]|jgi:hypothetical protein|nr:hypothetical protein [Gemmatimonadales bacterium]
MRVTVAGSIRAVAVATLIMVAGCGDGPTAPGIQPQITNLADVFSYQVSSIQHFSGTSTYTWQTSGTVAKITHASDAGATGSATLVVKDAAGTQVYSGELATSGEPLSAPAGVAGAWTITIVYSNYSNTQVNVAVLKQ